jgi:hypothetical protein
MMAKTKEEFQAAINDVRRVLEQHGVVMVASTQFRKGPVIELLDADALQADPAPCYTWFMDPPHEGSKLDELLPFNKVEQEVVHTPMVQGGRVAWTRIRAIGDVEGVIPTRITIHQHSTAISDVNVGKTVDVVSLDEVDRVDFVKEFRNARFKRFVIGLGDGPFGTLIAEYNGTAPMVVGFIEGPSPDELLKKWPLAQKGAQDGGV